MKIWYQHGSEHSANLVMIGRFKDVAEATKAKEIIDAIAKQVDKELSEGTLTLGDPPARYGEEMLELLGKLNAVTLGTSELEQFSYEVSVKSKGSDLVVTTEEYDISAFLKVMLLQGARIEVYSAHDHPDSEYGRGLG
ncbi:DUF6375 family protein (plasmid) [Synechococcus elongatus PCC 11801]|uniref:DUF6375 family protein n=1 Tax=Synechococcus elongatus PCC 11801 TaxID=2219813 RepID=A0ACD5A3I1_SYNEL